MNASAFDFSPLAVFPLSPAQEFPMTGPRPTTFDITLVDDVALITITGELTVRNRQELKQKALDLLESGQREFAVDFAQCSYIDTTGLGVLVSVQKKIREAQGTLMIRNLNEDLETLFALTKLDVLFTIERVPA